MIQDGEQTAQSLICQDCQMILRDGNNYGSAVIERMLLSVAEEKNRFLAHTGFIFSPLLIG